MDRFTAGARPARPRRIDTTQVYAQVRAARLKQAVGFYEEKASRGTDEINGTANSVFEELVKVPQTRS